MEFHEMFKLPKSCRDKFKPCWKCGKQPKSYSITNYFEQENYICCPNEDCDNKIKLRGGHYSDYIDEWNKKNIEKYISNSILRETENCNKCIHKFSCNAVREADIQYLYCHICDDFEIQKSNEKIKDE